MSSTATARLSSVGLSGTPLCFSTVRAWVGLAGIGGNTHRRSRDLLGDVAAQGALVVSVGEQIVGPAFQYQLASAPSDTRRAPSFGVSSTFALANLNRPIRTAGGHNPPGTSRQTFTRGCIETTGPGARLSGLGPIYRAKPTRYGALISIGSVAVAEEAKPTAARSKLTVTLAGCSTIGDGTATTLENERSASTRSAPERWPNQ